MLAVVFGEKWISTIGQIHVILAIELRDVEDISIVTHFKARESVGYNIISTFDIFKFREKIFEYYAPKYYAFCINFL